jgi:hypothetical protein
MYGYDVRQSLIENLVISHAKPCKDDEYKKDDIKFCCRCNTKRESWIKVDGIEYLVPVMCKCEEREWNRIYNGGKK